MGWQLDRLPFFDDAHYRLAERLNIWREANRPLFAEHATNDFGPVCKELVRRLAEAGFLDYIVPDPARGTEVKLDIRSLCVIREALAYDSCLADTMFVMQGLGLSPLWRHPDAGLRERYLGPARQGETIAALALTELEAGSDVASVTTGAVRDGNEYILNGSKSWISNGGIADHYMVVARTGEAAGSRGLSVFLVDHGATGLSFGAPVDLIAPHPISTVVFQNVRVPVSHMVGSAGEGFNAVMAGFDVFRPSVGAAAVGLARRALAESVERVRTRRMFGKSMAEMDGVQNRIADMKADTEAAALTVYRAAWTADVVGGRVSTEAALAKLVATEAAQRVADAAVQLFGAMGVARGSVVEQIYREVRPMRIYEGTSEVQKIVIARGVLRDRAQ